MNVSGHALLPWTLNLRPRAIHSHSHSPHISPTVLTDTQFVLASWVVQLDMHCALQARTTRARSCSCCSSSCTPGAAWLCTRSCSCSAPPAASATCSPASSSSARSPRTHSRSRSRSVVHILIRLSLSLWVHCALRGITVQILVQTSRAVARLEAGGGGNRKYFLNFE